MAALFSPLRVRLVGLLADRIKNEAEQKGMLLADAERYMKTRDRERNQFVKSHFSKDPADPTRCDLLLNRSRWSISACADLIIQALRIVEIQSAV